MPVVQYKLKHLIKQNHFSQKDIADYLNLNPSTLNQKLNGKLDFNKTEIDYIIDLFNKSYEEIFFKNELPIMGKSNNS